MRKIKRALTGILAATMVMASVLTAAASDTGGTHTSDEGSSAEEYVPVAVVTEAQAAAREEGAAISVAGSSVRTTIAGAYVAKSVQGAAVVTPLANVRASLGLTNGQKPYVIMYDTDVAKSNLAMASINAAAEALGANVITSLNIELGARENGKFVSLSNGSIGMVVGIPSSAIDPTKTYSMICVQPGGVISILEDQDANPNTITFELKAGLGTYSIVAQSIAAQPIVAQ